MWLQNTCCVLALRAALLSLSLCDSHLVFGNGFRFLSLPFSEKLDESTVEFCMHTVMETSSSIGFAETSSPMNFK